MLYTPFESCMAGWGSSAGIMIELLCIVIHLLYRCPCCLAGDPCWCHQNVHAGGGEIGPDNVQRCDWLFRENGDRGASELCGRERSNKHTLAMSHYGEIRGFTGKEKAFQDSSNCGVVDVCEIAFERAWGLDVTPALVSSLSTCFHIISTVCFNSSDLLQRLFYIHFWGQCLSGVSFCWTFEVSFPTKFLSGTKQNKKVLLLYAMRCFASMSGFCSLCSWALHFFLKLEIQ